MGGRTIIVTGNNLHDITEVMEIINIKGGQYEEKKILYCNNADQYGIVQCSSVR